jgi:hypothetical protein
MKKFILALTFMVLLGDARAFADTQTFAAYGAATLGGKSAMNVGTSVAFPGFTLITSGCSLQLDAPGYFSATNYEMFGNQGDLTRFHHPPDFVRHQPSQLRGFPRRTRHHYRLRGRRHHGSG